MLSMPVEDGPSRAVVCKHIVITNGVSECLGPGGNSKSLAVLPARLQLLVFPVFFPFGQFADGILTFDSVEQEDAVKVVDFVLKDAGVKIIV